MFIKERAKFSKSRYASEEPMTNNKILYYSPRVARCSPRVYKRALSSSSSQLSSVLYPYGPTIIKKKRSESSTKKERNSETSVYGLSLSLLLLISPA